MILPFENDTRAVEKKIAAKSFFADRRRNLFAVIAIIMTTILFTGLFTLGSGLVESTQRANMILSGGDGHAMLTQLNGSEYEKISKHPSIAEIAYSRKLADSVDNTALSKRETIFWYYDDQMMAYRFVNPTSGRKPEAKNEIITDTETLELLGVPTEVGAEIPLELTVHGKKVKRSFILSGWWESYPGIPYGTILASRAYMEAHETELTHTDRQDHTETGTITGTVKFQEDSDLEEAVQTLVKDSGYTTEDVSSENFINAGVNPLYGGSESEQKDYRGTMLALICALAVFFVTGYLMIYNVFQISVLKDLHFYGLLKTIGTTQRQIHVILRRQAWRLSLIGIPIGLLGGFLIGKGLLPQLVAQSSFSEAFAVVSPNPLLFIGAALFALITVRLSIRKPAKMAAKVSPVEALRFTGSEPGKKRRAGKCKRVKGGNGSKGMAWRNLGRNKGRTVLVVLSLSLSLVLANGVFLLVGSVNPEYAVKGMIVSDFCIGQSNLLDYYEIEESSALRETFIRAVEQQPGFVKGGRQYGCKAEYTSVTTKQDVNRTESGTFSTHLYGMDPFLLGQMEVLDGEVDPVKLASGNYILEGAFSNTRGEIEESSINHRIGDTVRIVSEGKERTFTVLGHVIANESNTYDWVESCFYLPSKQYVEFTGKHTMTYNFEVDPKKEAEMETFLKQYTAKVEPDMTYKSKGTIAAGVTEIRNIVLSIGGLMALIIGVIGVLNFVNTILTGIFTRRRELAVLQSVGMTQRQMLQMLRMEGCSYVFLAATVAIPLCVLSTMLLIRPLCDLIWFLHFELNLLPLLTLLLLLIAVGIGTPYAAYRAMQQKTLIEQLKMGE